MNKFIGKYKKECLAIFFLLIMALLFSYNSPLNPFIRAESATDSSVFRYVAIMMDNGFMPYVDTFDHKGPLLYVINYVGYKIGHTSGIWLLEVITLSTIFISLYKIARLKVNEMASIFVVLLSTVVMFNYFEGGNSTEEYSLLFISISTYIFLDYLLNNKINTFRVIICGLCFSAVCFIRINMIACWIIFCLSVLIKCIKEKKIKELISFVIKFTIGILIIAIPIITWLASKGAISDFIEQYFRFNFSYSSEEVKFGQKLSAFFHFISTPCVLAITGCLISIKNKKEKNIALISLIYIITNYILCSISGNKYSHYGMQLIAAFIYPLTYLVTLKKENNITFIAIVLAIVIAPPWIALSEQASLYEEMMYKDNVSPRITSITNIIEENTDIDDKITVYGNWDYIYIKSNRLSASKYSYQFPIGDIKPKIMKEYFEQIKISQPKIIVVQENKMNDIMRDFINDNNYNIIFDENGTDSGVRVYKLEPDKLVEKNKKK